MACLLTAPVLGNHLVDGAGEQEVGLGNLVVLAFDDLLEGADGFLQGNILALVTGELLGDVAILARHMDYVAPLGMGRATVVSGGQRRNAACIGGMLSVSGGEVTLVPTTFEWSDKIDVERAEAAYQRADKVLHDENASQMDLKLAEAKLHRALVRKSVASNK